MSARIRRLQRILALARNDERKSAVLASDAQSRLLDQRRRLGELSAHKPNYTRRAQQSGELAAAHWKDFQHFLGRLDEAVYSQKQIIRDCEVAVASQRRRWLVKRQRVESLQKLLERFRQEERIVTDRMEQRELDELPDRSGKFGRA